MHLAVFINSGNRTRHININRFAAVTVVPWRIKPPRVVNIITEKKIVLKERIDASIMGGLVVRYGTQQLDGSLKSRLDSFEKMLSDTII